MRKKDEEGYEAKRKRQQREGYLSLNGVMAPPGLKQRLIVEGFLAETAKDNRYALMGAVERWIERQLLLPPELPDTVTNPKVEKRPLTKVKRRQHPQHGPVYRMAPTRSRIQVIAQSSTSARMIGWLSQSFDG
jgi:hypothetical protein